MMDDPRAILDAEPMSRFQWIVVAIMIGLNALDGFDVLSISFASPGIAAAWHVKRDALGLVLSMELIGMAVGSILLGRLADRSGRRRVMLVCLAIMAAGMIGASTAGGVKTLSGWRLLTGLGIGGMLAATNAAVAEVTNADRRSIAVVLMAGGYPVGTIVGGLASSWLLARYDWRAIFVFGGVVTACFIPLVLWRAPESIAFLMHRRPPDALSRINATLRRMGHATVERLVLLDATVRPSIGLAALFSGTVARRTVLLTLAYLAHVMTFYFILKWIPKIVVDMGFSPPLAAGVLVWASVGGAAGAGTLGLLTARARLLWLTVTAMLFSTGLVIWFGQGQKDLAGLSLVAAAAGFATNAGIVGLYGLMAQAFPTELRATATGFIIGVGRGGSALAPALAGWLFATGNGLPAVATIMALGSAVGAAALFADRRTLAVLG
nr:MFS transporter [Sphingomonas bacterium]